MKKFTAIIAAAALLAAAAGSSCSGNKDAQADAQDAVVVLSVDTVKANPEAFVGDTITVEGLCTHLCAHGARKAFIANADTTIILRCNAGDSIGAFDRAAIGQNITVKGVLCPQTLTLSQIEALAAAELQPDTTATEGHCGTEKRAAGSTATQWLDKLNAQIQAGGDTTLVVDYYLAAESYTMPEN